MNWVLMPLRRYADFTGRSQRQEFWMFFLFQTLVVIGIFALALPAFAYGEGAGGIGIVFALVGWAVFSLAMLVPNCALVVRRLHDQDIDSVVGVLLYIGLWIFNLIGLIILIFMCIDGKPYTNKYGPDPKGRGTSDIFS